jgi:hypothetical protein
VGGGSIGEAIRKGIEPARFLAPGDVVEMEVEGLGLLRSTVGGKGDSGTGYRYRAREQPALPERGIARGFQYQLKVR